MDTFEGRSDDPLTFHKYLYCSGSPVNMSDPSGHEGMIDLVVSMFISTDLDTINARAQQVAARKAVTAKVFEFDLGFEWGAGTGGWGPHSFLFVPNKITGSGLKYDVTGTGDLWIHTANRSKVAAGAWFGKLFKLADFSLPQYLEWTSTAWIIADADRAESQLLTPQVLRTQLGFSYSFLPQTVNCFKWTFYAAIEGVAIAKLTK
jgi:hypothetical protein